MKDPNTRTLGVPTRELTTSQQFNNLLGAASIISGILAPHRSPFDTSETPPGGKLDGGVASAAEVTLIAIFDRVEQIVADKSRWNADGYEALEKALLKSVNQQSKLLEAQKFAALAAADTQHELGSPHVRQMPTLVRLSDGNYAAFTGNLSSGDAILGIGDSPRRAMENFDEVFEGRLPEDMKKYHESKSLDTQRNPATPTTEEPRNEPLRGRKSSRKKPPVGRKETGPTAPGSDPTQS